MTVASSFSIETFGTVFPRLIPEERRSAGTKESCNGTGESRRANQAHGRITARISGVALSRSLPRQPNQCGSGEKGVRSEEKDRKTRSFVCSPHSLLLTSAISLTF